MRIIRTIGIIKMAACMPVAKLHTVCRGSFYPRTNNKIKRVEIPECKVNWVEPFPEYCPTVYTTESILMQPTYADLDSNDPNFNPRWNALDGNVDRRSHKFPYKIINGVPRNFEGRTGVRGRGCLGKWGPNHAADPIVTRWKRQEGKIVMGGSGKPILQFVSIQRRDNGQWAIPGGMVDPGEKITSTLKREFMEEALNSFSMTHQEEEEAKVKVEALFSKGVEVYRGYVDDPRNTDNAWMETVAFNFHEDSDSGVLANMELVAGDDAKNVAWADLTTDLDLYASHKSFVECVAKMRNAHW